MAEAEALSKISEEDISRLRDTEEYSKMHNTMADRIKYNEYSIFSKNQKLKDLGIGKLSFKEKLKSILGKFFIADFDDFSPGKVLDIFKKKNDIDDEIDKLQQEINEFNEKLKKEDKSGEEGGQEGGGTSTSEESATPDGEQSDDEKLKEKREELNKKIDELTKKKNDLEAEFNEYDKNLKLSNDISWLDPISSILFSPFGILTLLGISIYYIVEYYSNISKSKEIGLKYCKKMKNNLPPKTCCGSKQCPCSYCKYKDDNRDYQKVKKNENIPVGYRSQSDLGCSISKMCLPPEKNEIKKERKKQFENKEKPPSVNDNEIKSHNFMMDLIQKFVIILIFIVLIITGMYFISKNNKKPNLNTNNVML